jgi:hypothetical protein
VPQISSQDLAFMQGYILDCRWKAAKSGATHEYTVREWRPEHDKDFVRFVQLIRSYGHPENFYSKTYIYFVVNDLKYWTMGSPMDETIIINRADKDTYYSRQFAAQPDPNLSETVYDKLAPRYDERYSTPECFAEDEMLFGMLNDFVNGSVLDIGCGTGTLVENLGVPPHDYLGIDPSQGMMNEFIRKFPQHSFLQTKFEDFTAVPFDFAVSLYGSASYIDPSSYKDMAEAASNYFFMFYKKGYLPDYYESNTTKTDYEAIKLFFDRTFEFTNYLVATNLPIEVKND